MQDEEKEESFQSVEPAQAWQDDLDLPDVPVVSYKVFH